MLHVLGVDIDEVAAQLIQFLLAGLINTVPTITFCLYEIARHPEVESKVVKEITEVMKKHWNIMSYQAVQEMSYLEAVIHGKGMLGTVKVFFLKTLLPVFVVSSCSMFNK